MRNAVRLWLLLALSYVAARYAVRVVAAGIWTLDRETLAHVAIVPLGQLVVLELLRRTLTLRLP
jgi:hypothetical protein